ncbi:TPA: hypothetical protein WI316_001335 [Neisseria meningitidis]
MPQIRMVAPTASDGILAAVLGFVSGLPLCLVMMILGAVFSVLMCGMPSERRFRRHSGHFCAVRRSNMPPSAK